VLTADRPGLLRPVSRLPCEDIKSTPTRGHNSPSLQWAQIAPL
jgi:hypothetical protein